MPSDEKADGHGSFTDKLRAPFHELKEKLRDTHLHDAKIHLTHKKCVFTTSSGSLRRC